jgi:chromosome segregation ATPase
MLERSSRLSAISTLISAYGRELTVIDQSDQPIQDQLNDLRSELERTQALLERAIDVGTIYDAEQYTRRVSELHGKIESLELRAHQNENLRAKARQKHERLVAELEEVVEEAEEAKRKQSAS